MKESNIIYIAGVIIITTIIAILYVRSVIQHNFEIEKIESIEKNKRDIQDQINIIRLRTTKCPFYTENNPRSCYFDSRYKCSWNDEAQRCDLK